MIIISAFSSSQLRCLLMDVSWVSPLFSSLCWDQFGSFVLRQLMMSCVVLGSVRWSSFPLRTTSCRTVWTVTGFTLCFLCGGEKAERNMRCDLKGSRGKPIDLFIMEFIHHLIHLFAGDADLKIWLASPENFHFSQPATLEKLSVEILLRPSRRSPRSCGVLAAGLADSWSLPFWLAGEEGPGLNLYDVSSLEEEELRSCRVVVCFQ